MSTVRSYFTRGAIFGVALAIVLLPWLFTLPLSNIYPSHLSLSVDAAIQKSVFYLCPLYRLGFWQGVRSWTVLFSVAAAGNVVMYGVLFAAIGAVVVGIRKFAKGASDET